MTALDARPVVVPDDAEPRPNKRPRHIKGTRPGWFIYACLAVVMLARIRLENQRRRRPPGNLLRAH